jgi:hypothetical protein
MCHKSEIGVGKGNSFSNDGGASSRALVLLDGRQPAYCGDFERGEAGWDLFVYAAADACDWEWFGSAYPSCQ